MKKSAVLIIIFGIFGAVFFILFFKLSPLERYFLTDNTAGKRLILPVWHSLKRTANIVHFPYWFKESRLKTYYLELSPSDLETLNNNLPVDPQTGAYGRMTEEYKIFVKAQFKSKNYNSGNYNYEDDVKVRYRGLSSNNWNAQKKAFMISFPAKKLFEGKKTINLFLPDDRSYFAEPLSAYRAKKMGLNVPEFEFVRLIVNGQDNGVYLAAEHWSPEWLEKNNMYADDNILSSKDANLNSASGIFSFKRLNDWKSYTAKNEEGPFEELEALIQLVEKADNGEFSEKIGNLIELEKFYNFEIINVLAGSNHQNDGGNVVLLFKTETGKFEPLPWDVSIYPMEDNFYVFNNKIIRRVLSIPEFYEEYRKRLEKYATDEKNLSDDLSFYDNLDKKLKGEFYNDQVKLDNDFAFEKKVKEIREIFIANFNKAKELSKLNEYPAPAIKKIKSGKTSFGGNFKYFNEISNTADELIALHPQFKKNDAETIVLKTGVYAFLETIIIPRGLKLVIEPGTRIYFAPEVSFVSYSPVIAMGTPDLAITLYPLYPEKEAWGSFAVINAGSQRSLFRYISVGGGSSGIINGAVLTSQFSLNNADANIENSVFENSRSDDGAHVLLGSVLIKNNSFRDNSSDAIDLDYASNSAVEKNNFLNNGGDCIDLSGMSNVSVKNNIMKGCGDKGISVGERSFPVIENNNISQSDIGIAVKDMSSAAIKDNDISNNRIGVSAYQKKQVWGGSSAFLANNILSGNKINIEKDKISTVKVEE